MALEDTVDRLRIDAGARTIGELIQDREIAVYEIRRLTAEIARLQVLQTRQRPNSAEIPAIAPSYRARTLIRLKDVCELVGISRSTVYKRISDGTFPPPIRVGPRTVRWQLDAIETWCDAL